MSPPRSRRRKSGRNGGQLQSSSRPLAPLMEEPSAQEYEETTKKLRSWSSVRDWFRHHLDNGNGNASANANGACPHMPDLKLLLGVLGCPLGPTSVANEPLPHLSIKDVPIETSSAQYIVQQFMAASGCLKFQNCVKSSYMVGRFKMVSSECEMATAKTSQRYPPKGESGCFVLWQMMPDMWSMELVLAGSKVHAGSNGIIVWRHTPWLGTHAAKGPPRPLRRALQGLDPRTIAIMFSNARCLGEKKMGDEDCFVLKLAADPSTLQERSDGPAEIIRHVIFGYFSQKTGLLVHLEDSHLTRIQTTGIDAVYWETTMETSISNYKPVDGVMIAHSGKSVVTLFKFGEAAMSHTRTRMKETWTIDDVVFNVPGLSVDCFIPPAEVIQNGEAGDVNSSYNSHLRCKSAKLENGVIRQGPISNTKNIDR